MVGGFLFFFSIMRKNEVKKNAFRKHTTNLGNTKFTKLGNSFGDQCAVNQGVTCPGDERNFVGLKFMGIF